MAVVKDLSGQRFGRLTAVRCVGRTNNGNAQWLCKCDCGGEKVIASWGLRSDRTHSCGCIKQEQNKTIFTTHGREPKHLYRTWTGLRNRCNNRNNHKYADYGGRGISVCSEWDASYEVFRDWAFQNGYQDNLTIERKDVNGPYSPENCKWATQKEQQNNRRNNHRVTLNGETKTFMQWCEFLGIGRTTVEKRLKRGWDVKSAFMTPSQRAGCA